MSKTALITGATGGIGKALCHQLVENGFQLVLVSRDQQKLEALKTDLDAVKHGCVLDIFSADLAKRDSAEKVVNFTEQADLKIDVLVNNAGIGLYGKIEESVSKDVYAMMMLNMFTLTDLCIRYAKVMKARGDGKILNIGSLGAYQPVPLIAAYAASKSYVLNFSEAIAMELQGTGVQVSCFSPGHTNTGFFEAAQIKSHHPFYHVKTRAPAEQVAAQAIRCLLKGSMSEIGGLKNKCLAFLNRLVSRRMSARISRTLVWHDA